MANRYHLVFLVVIATALLLPNLANIYLWQDEAETAILARNILTHGYPSAWDGTNVVTQNHEREFNARHVWTWSPWLQLYLTAGSFWIFGETTFAARIPFVVLAVASIALLHVYVGRLTGSRRIALFAGLWMTTSIPFLLHARQCRWYMAAVFGTIWLLYAYLRMTDGRGSGVVQFVVASLLLFHGNYLVLVYVLGGIVLHFLVSPLLHSPRPPLRSMATALSSVVLLSAPWAIYARIWDRPNPLEEYRLPLLARAARILLSNLTNLNQYLLPFPLAALLPWIWIRRRKLGLGMDRGVALFVLVLLVALIQLSFLPWMYFRYLIGLVPVCCILLGIVIEHLFVLRKVLGLGVLALGISTNGFTLLLPPHQLRSDLLRYFYEISHDYDGPDEGIVEYLKTHGRPDQLVVTNYGQLPIIFYTRMRAVGFGQDPHTAEDPDWIIVRRNRGDAEYLLARASGYRKIVIDYPDIPWGNRADPNRHHFRTAEGVPPVVIFQKPTGGTPG